MILGNILFKKKIDADTIYSFGRIFKENLTTGGKFLMHSTLLQKYSDISRPSKDSTTITITIRCRTIRAFTKIKG
jgi:hypothetical protein